MNISLVIGIFVSLIHKFVDTTPPLPINNPFLFSIDVNSPGLLELPRKTIPSLSDLHTDNFSKTVVAACPADKLQKKLLAKISKTLPYCLFQKNFLPNEMETCAEEVKPMLRTQYSEINHQPKSCGTNPINHLMYEYGFYYCGTTDTLTQLLNKINKKKLDDLVKPRFYPIYEICIDTPNRKALWTKHFIRAPEIFLNKSYEEEQKLQNEAREYDGKINEGDLPSKMRAENFESWDRKFNIQNSNNRNKLALETFMVSMEHVAIKMWRKALNHYINVAPFNANKIRLMNGINNGIKRIALILHSENKRLSIYTAVRKFNNEGQRGSNWHDVQGSLVWYKLLYEEVNQLATMVVLHSTDQQTEPEKKGCKIIVICETMKNWYEKQSEEDVDGLANDLLRFAYCCKPDMDEIEDIFNFHLEIRESLPIDEYFLEKKLPPTPPASPTSPASPASPASPIRGLVD